MRKAVWKYTLEVADEQIIEMPIGAEMLTVETQRGFDADWPTLWALVDVDADKSQRKIAMRGTGHHADGLEAARYVGTAQLLGGRLVYHVFDRGDGPLEVTS